MYTVLCRKICKHAKYEFSVSVTLLNFDHIREIYIQNVIDLCFGLVS